MRAFLASEPLLDRAPVEGPGALISQYFPSKLHGMGQIGCAPMHNGHLPTSCHLAADARTRNLQLSKSCRQLDLVGPDFKRKIFSEVGDVLAPPSSRSQHMAQSLHDRWPFGLCFAYAGVGASAF